MIHVERSRVDVPRFFAGKTYEMLRAEAAEHHRRHTKDSRRFEFGLARLRKGVDATLDELFHSKCAYCEVSVARTVPMRKAARPDDPVRRNFEHFRPKRNAVGLEGDSSLMHYWWLFYEWNNLYVACQTCNVNKRTQFPVVGYRAEPETAWAEIDEKRLLIDPCVDEPSEYLFFTAMGTVESKPIRRYRKRWQAMRGEHTINALGLNRVQLRDARGHAYYMLQSRLNEVVSPEWKERMRRSLGDDVPFSALHRQMFARWALDQDDAGEYLAWLEALCPGLLAAERDRFEERMADLERFESAGGEPEEAAPPEEEEHEGTGPEEEAEAEEAGPEASPSREASKKVASATISRVSIRDFKAIRRLDLVLDGGQADGEVAAPESEGKLAWFSFLGENGAGKSSILQAIALALAGPAIQGDDTLGGSARFVRRQDAADAEGARRTAFVRLDLSTGTRVRLGIRESGFLFEERWQPPAVFVRAYGATRFPGRALPEHGNADDAAAIEYRNLFDPFKPLLEVKPWLKEVARDTERRTAVRQALEDLLGLKPQEDEEDASKLRIDIDEDGELTVDNEPLENLSSGYQTLIALAADIMAGVPPDRGDMQDAGGIVLLDEIGAHLHPGWKMHVVSRLRDAFRGMQFITTTHEPLCLRGHFGGEVAVVKRGRIEVPSPKDPAAKVRVFDVQLTTDLPSPRNLRVDQLLTSPHFGLDSTIDPELDEAFREYYGLLARRHEDLDPAQQDRLEELRLKLRGEGILGYTRRDQLVYEAIDKYIADERRIEERAIAAEATDDAKKERREQVKRQVIDLWRFVRDDDAERGARP